MAYYVLINIQILLAYLYYFHSKLLFALKYSTLILFANKFSYFFVLVNKPSAKVCEMDLNEENFQSLKYAVDNHYWYQMYIGMYIG